MEKERKKYTYKNIEKYSKNIVDKIGERPIYQYMSSFKKKNGEISYYPYKIPQKIYLPKKEESERKKLQSMKNSAVKYLAQKMDKQELIKILDLCKELDKIEKRPAPSKNISINIRGCIKRMNNSDDVLKVIKFITNKRKASHIAKLD